MLRRRVSQFCKDYSDRDPKSHVFAQRSELSYVCILFLATNYLQSLLASWSFQTFNPLIHVASRFIQQNSRLVKMSAFLYAGHLLHFYFSDFTHGHPTLTLEESKATSYALREKILVLLFPRKPNWHQNHNIPPLSTRDMPLHLTFSFETFSWMKARRTLDKIIFKLILKSTFNTLN